MKYYFKYFLFFCIFVFISSTIAINSAENPTSGLMIVAMGLPGSGKSTVFRELSREMDAILFAEPEEQCWPDAVLNREISGNHTMISWFRSIRVPMLFQADLVRQNGEIALVDSYYDKLLIHYLGKEGMEWLISSSDPYYDVVCQVATLDWKLLPNPDVLVFFDLDLNTWKAFLKKRNRKLDNEDEFIKSYKTKDLFWNAVEQLAKENSVKVIRFSQNNLSPHEAAVKLKAVLINEGILNH